MMDRTYGINAGELSGDDINREMLRKRRELDKQNKEKRLFEMALNGVFEISLKSLELKENPLLNLTPKEKGVIILSIGATEGDNSERIKVLTELALDPANTESRQFLGANWNSANVIEFYFAVKEFLAIAGRNKILSEIESFKKIKNSIEIYVTDQTVEKYTEMNSQLDKRTLVYLIENGLLK